MQCTMEIEDSPARRSFDHAGPDGHVSIYKLVLVPRYALFCSARAIGYFFRGSWAGARKVLARLSVLWDYTV